MVLGHEGLDTIPITAAADTALADLRMVVPAAVRQLGSGGVVDAFTAPRQPVGSAEVPDRGTSIIVSVVLIAAHGQRVQPPLARFARPAHRFAVPRAVVRVGCAADGVGRGFPRRVGRRDVLLREVSSAASADRRGGVEPTLSSCASYLVIGVMQAGLELPNPCAHGVGGSRVLQGVGLQLFLYRALHALNGLECLRAENRPTGSPGCNASAKCLQVVHLRGSAGEHFFASVVPAQAPLQHGSKLPCLHGKGVHPPVVTPSGAFAARGVSVDDFGSDRSSMASLQKRLRALYTSTAQCCLYPARGS